ncbi:unnamed protein product [Arabis nemorensis]|uniref:Uncharacterized protein n=1 Tax=Arabis nemorensis TaxID=586526 RepID=A0A565BJX5_9BRAS|nr:unnamed protein product [Arabis nemorensis]
MVYTVVYQTVYRWSNSVHGDRGGTVYTVVYTMTDGVHSGVPDGVHVGIPVVKLYTVTVVGRCTQWCTRWCTR